MPPPYLLKLQKQMNEILLPRASNIDTPLHFAAEFSAALGLRFCPFPGSLFFQFFPYLGQGFLPLLQLRQGGLALAFGLIGPRRGLASGALLGRLTFLAFFLAFDGRALGGIPGLLLALQFGLAFALGCLAWPAIACVPHAAVRTLRATPRCFA